MLVLTVRTSMVFVSFNFLSACLPTEEREQQQRQRDEP